MNVRQTFQIVLPLCQRVECGVSLPWLSWIAIICIHVNRLSLYFSSKLIFFFFLFRSEEGSSQIFLPFVCVSIKVIESSPRFTFH